MAIIQFENGVKVKFDGNPTPQDVEEVAQKLGISKKKSILDKAVNVGQKASQFLFGSTSKTVGSLLGAGVESGAQLLTGKKEEGKFITKEGTPKLFSEQSGTSSAADIAFTSLELFPGGSQLTKQLAKIPGGAKIVDGITNALKSVPAHLKESAIKEYSSIFRATSKESKGLAEKVVPQLLKSKSVITSTEKLGEKASAKLLPIGKKIEQTIDKLPASVKIDAGDVVSQLDKMRSKYIVAGKVVDNAKVKVIDDTKKMIAQFGEKIPAQDIIQIRRILDESIDEAGGFIADKATKFAAKVEKTAAGAIRSELAKEIPDLDKLNKQFSFWNNVKNLSKYTTKKTSPILRRTAGSGVGGTIGALQGDSLESRISGAVAGAFLGNQAIKFIQSPAWKSVSAITKNEIADLMASGKLNKVNEVIKRLIIGTKNYGE